MNEANELSAKRARLAEIDRELAGLRSQHDLAMSAFKFDEASALQRRIAAYEGERRVLVAGLPPPQPAADPATGIVPVLARPRHLRRRR